MGTSRSSSSVLGFLARHAQRTAPDLIGRVAEAAAKLAPSCRVDATEMEKELASLTADFKAATNALKDQEQAEQVEREAAARNAENEAAAARAVSAAVSAARWLQSQMDEAEETGGGAAGGVGGGVGVEYTANYAAAEGAATAKSESAVAQPEAAAAAPSESADKFAPVMRAFVGEAGSQLEELQASTAKLEGAAAKVCAFYCEREDKSVAAAHTLLVRLHAFGSGLVGAHEQAQSERQAQAAWEAKRQAKESAAGIGMATRSSKRAVAAASAEAGGVAAAAAGGGGVGAGGEEFEANEASLRAILESEDGENADPSSLNAGTPGHADGKRLTHARRATTNADGEATIKSPDELQKLFLRRASGLSMAKGEKGGGAVAAQAPPVPPSPSKRPRSNW